MEIYDFSDKIIKDLSLRIESEIGQLIKVDASRHDRIAGRIDGLSDALSLIKQTRKTWTLRDSAQEEEDL